MTYPFGTKTSELLISVPGKSMDTELSYPGNINYMQKPLELIGIT